MVDVKTGPYEILIRFTCEIGEKFGVVRGTQLGTRSVLVDENGIITAKIDRGREDHPHDFPTEDLPGYLGDRFTAFDAQLDIMRADSASMKDALDASRSELAAANQTVDSLRKQIESLTAERDAAKAATAAANQTVDSLRNQIESLTAEIDAVGVSPRATN